MLDHTGNSQGRARARVSLCGACIAVLATAAASSAPLSNVAPQLWGWAPRWAHVGVKYDFKPTAYDANRDKLTFSISNRPAWASFDRNTGRLTGTPAASYGGSSTNIVMRVSDGKQSVALPAFTLRVGRDWTPPTTNTATVSWMPPTENSDGSTLTNLAGYRVVYGRDRTALDQVVTIGNVGVTRYVIEGLGTGTWYFAVRTFNRSGVESVLSSIGRKTLQ